MPDLTSVDDCYFEYAKLHEKDPHFCSGVSIEEQLPALMQLTRWANIRTAIDYGCGKAAGYDNFRIRRLLRLDEIVLFDPAVKAFCTYPSKPADLVICIDVLEHVPEHLLDDVLADMASLATKAIYITISTKPARKTFEDGENLHVTQKPLTWWKAKLANMPVYTVVNASV